MGAEDRPKLEPARPDAAEGRGKPAYAPKIPWKTISAVILGFAGIFTIYAVRQDSRKERLRAEMLAFHETELSEISERYLGFRRRIEELVRQAHEAGEPDNWADPRLNISRLRSGEGLYLRIPAEWADSSERIEGAARAMERDAITRCLGIAAMSMRGLYEKGFFLTPEWVDQVREEQDMMSLRVLEDQLGRYYQVDAPVVQSIMEAEWFLLVLQQGENRRDHPVDVYLWDLRHNQQILRARIQSRGLLVPVRLRFEGTYPRPAPGRPQVQSGGANDCSIASQIRALTGAEPLEFESGAAVIEAARAAEEEAEDDAEGGNEEPSDSEGDAEDESAEPPEPAEEP